MIDKDYFRRQAKTLRNMVNVARDRAVAERLSVMADDFEARAADESRTLGEPAGRLAHGAGEGHGSG